MAQVVNIYLILQAFLGQRHGYDMLPCMIQFEQFGILVDTLEEAGEDTQLIHTWYKIDENEVPPVYILQPISSILGNNWCHLYMLQPLSF